MKNRTAAYWLLFCSVSSACSGSKFSGNGAPPAPQSQPGEKAAVNSVDSAGSKAIPVACDKDAVGITQARLLSNGINTQGQSQALRYELSVLNCKDGSAQSLQNQPILFDLDAAFSSGFTPIPYAILDKDSKILTSGMLEVIEGNDLFGRTGQYAHWKTQNLSYTSQQDLLILEISFKDIQIFPGDPAAAKINSFLRVGNAQPIVQPLDIVNVAK